MVAYVAERDGPSCGVVERGEEEPLPRGMGARSARLGAGHIGVPARPGYRPPVQGHGEGGQRRRAFAVRRRAR